MNMTTIVTDNSNVAFNAMRTYLNGKQPECTREWISWLISMLGRDHEVSKQLEPLMSSHHVADDKLKQIVYDIVADYS
jgi:hypothetical protein